MTGILFVSKGISSVFSKDAMPWRMFIFHPFFRLCHAVGGSWVQLDIFGVKWSAVGFGEGHDGLFVRKM